MKNSALGPAWAIMLCLGLAIPAFCESASTQAQQVYHIPDSVRSIAALSRKLPAMTPARVERIVDGDTIVVSFDPATGLGTDEKVRLIGVDTPETVDPRKPVQFFGAEASRFVAASILGKTVRLAFEPTIRDYFGRLLAYVFLEDGTCFNMAIIAEGYGFAYTKYPFMFMDDFNKAEQKACESKKGRWK
jgi:micrococcal nuclease